MFKGFYRFQIRNLYKVAPGAAPGAAPRTAPGAAPGAGDRR